MLSGSVRRPNSALSAGGATNVVAMTMSSTAPNTSSPRTPERRPISAKIEPTSPRGIIPTPTTSRRNGSTGAAQPAAILPTIASTISTPGDRRACLARVGIGRVEQTEIDRRADADEEDGREDRRHRLHFVLDGVELVGARQNEARGEGADDERRARDGGRGGQPEREGEREDEQHIPDPHPHDDVEEPRHQEPARHHRHHQESRPPRARVRADAEDRDGGTRRPCRTRRSG